MKGTIHKNSVYKKRNSFMKNYFREKNRKQRAKLRKKRNIT